MRLHGARSRASGDRLGIARDVVGGVAEMSDNAPDRRLYPLAVAVSRATGARISGGAGDDAPATWLDDTPGDRLCDRRLSGIDVEHLDEAIPAAVPAERPGNLPPDLAEFGNLFRHGDGTVIRAVEEIDQ